MNKARLTLVHKAFAKLDKDGSGVVTPDDLKVEIMPYTAQLYSARKQYSPLSVRVKNTMNMTRVTSCSQGVYSAKKHPKYISGEMTEDDVFIEFLSSFNGDDDDGEVGRTFT